MIEDIVKQGIIEPAALHTLLADPSVKILDSTFVLPGSAEYPDKVWQKERISHAAFFDIDDIADRNTHLPHMLPSPKEFEGAVSALGISNDDLVVIYGQSGMVMGPARAWWMFRAFGHNKVCVLNGGLPAWRVEGYKLNTDPPQTPSSNSFKASLQPDLVCNIKDVQKAIKDRGTTILDARPAPRFNGEAPEPRESLHSGHMKGSRNIPAGSLVDSQSGRLKSPEALYEIFVQADYKPGNPVITTCGSGVTACMIALALYRQGCEAAVYDGSWAEWGDRTLKNEII